MTDFSVEPGQVLADNLAQGYVGMHFQQGVPILDRDLNLIQDLAAATVRRILADYLGSGVAPVSTSDGTVTNDAFLVKAAAAAQNNDFVISAGSAPPGRGLVNGLEATITADLAYTAQLNVDPQQDVDPLQPPAAGDRTDTVFLDVFLTTDESGPVMDNADDVVVQTSVRLRPSWLVRVAVGTRDVPPAALGHGHLPLAQIARRAGSAHISSADITDRRPFLFSASDLRRILLDPAVSTSTPAGKVGDNITITGRNFQIAADDKVTVLFDATPAVELTITPTSLTVRVPVFAPALTGSPVLPLTVRTEYGYAQRTFRVITN